MKFWNWLSEQKHREDAVGYFAKERCPAWSYSWLERQGSFENVHELLYCFKSTLWEARAFTECWEEWTELVKAYYRASGTWPKWEPLRDPSEWTYESIPEYSAKFDALKSRHGSKWQRQMPGWFPQDRPGFVYYVLSENGIYKIGRTNDIGTRFKALNIETPFDLKLVAALKTDDCVELERRYHAFHAEHRLKGEWFAISPDKVPASGDLMMFEPDWNVEIPDEVKR